MLNKTIKVITKDQHSFEISCIGDKSAKRVLLFFPAMGVEARYYRVWASSMAEQGFLCCISDWRGHGTSSLRPKTGANFGYHTMIEQDYNCAIDAVRNYADSEELYLGGHSLGGQLSCLFAGTRSDDQSWLSGIILIAACTISHKGWPGIQGFVMRFVPYIFSTVARWVGYFPGNKLNFAGIEAKQQILDWAQSGIDGFYQPKGYDSAIDRMMEKVEVPIISLSFEGDAYAPKAAVDNLVSKMPGCNVSRVHLTASDYPREILDHFKWARKSPEVTTELISSLITIE